MMRDDPISYHANRVRQERRLGLAHGDTAAGRSHMALSSLHAARLRILSSADRPLLSLVGGDERITTQPQLLQAEAVG